MISPPPLADLMADPGELDVSCLDCHHNTTCRWRQWQRKVAGEVKLPDNSFAKGGVNA